MVLTRSLYDAVTARRAAQRAAEGLPPEDPKDLPWLREDEISAEEKQPSGPQEIAPPPPTRGPLCRAAKAKIAERSESIPGFDRHSRKCQICRSPYVDYIEQVYLQWERVDLICSYFQLADTDTVYRHARAAGLDVLRRQNSRWVVEQFIEQWRTVKITSSTVIRSIRALSCLDDKGRWTDLPKTHILVRGSDVPPNERSESADENAPLPPAPSEAEGSANRVSMEN
jgi:hypothetical protein